MSAKFVSMKHPTAMIQRFMRSLMVIKFKTLNWQPGQKFMEQLSVKNGIFPDDDTRLIRRNPKNNHLPE
jgi:hypothetical protein